MFSLRIGRLKFFVLGFVFLLAEIIGLLAIISLTGGIETFDPYQPGASREPIFHSMAIIMIVLTLLRIFVASRRAADARVSQWVTFGYGLMLVIQAFLFVLVLLVWTPEKQYPGLGLLSLGCTAFWFSLLFPPSFSSPGTGGNTSTPNEFGDDFEPPYVSSEPAFVSVPASQRGMRSGAPGNRRQFGKRTRI